MKSAPRLKIPTAIWVIGLGSLLINLSSVMVFSLSTIYLKALQGVAIVWITFLDGFVEGIAYAMKILSGLISDYFRRRKSIFGLGLFLVTLSRPLLAISSSYGAVFLSRISDRMGNGIQATPRDALVSDIAPPSIKGECFGLRQALGTAGSFLGGVAGILAMQWTHNNYHQVFWLSTIPAALAFLLIYFFVKEPPEHLEEKVKHHPLHLSDLKRLGKTYWLLMGIVGIFMLARIGEALLMLHVHGFGLTETYSPVVYIIYNITYSLSSYPAGFLSDRFGRYGLLALGFLMLVAADLVLAAADSLSIALVGVALWGIQMGITQAMFLTLIADLVPEDLRGTGFGFFYLIAAVSIVIAASNGGIIGHIYSSSYSYVYSAGFAFVALFILLIGMKQGKFTSQASV